MGTETLCQYRYQIKTYTSALCGEHIKEQVRPCRCAARHSWSFHHNAKGKASESSAVVHSKTFKFSDLMDKNGVYNTLKSHVTSMKMEMQTVPSPFDAALLPINTSGEKNVLLWVTTCKIVCSKDTVVHFGPFFFKVYTFTKLNFALSL